MSPANLAATLAVHKAWLQVSPGGKRAGGRRANLQDAVLQGAVLRGAVLMSAVLSDADLRRANLQGAVLQDAVGLLTLATPPEEGSFIAYKKLGNGAVCKLEIPADARRTGSYVGRKCRAEYVKVLEGAGYSIHDSEVTYTPGEIVRPDAYDPDPRVECARGIHFFMTRKEAEDYQ